MLVKIIPGKKGHKGFPIGPDNTGEELLEKKVIYEMHFKPESDTINDYLSHLDFSGYEIVNCTFIGLELNDTDFRNCKLDNCTFTDCKLDNCTGNRTTVFIDSIFKNCEISHCIFSGCVCHNLQFNQCKLTNMYMEDSNIRGLSVIQCEMLRNTFNGSHFDTSNFLYCNIDFNLFHSTNFSGHHQHSFECSTMKLCDLSDSYFKNVSFEGTKLKSCRFNKSCLIDCKLDEKYKYMTGEILKKQIKGWKTCKDDAMVELEIPEGSIVYGVDGKQFRTNKCRVMSITSLKTGEKLESAVSEHNDTFIYRYGWSFNIDDFDLNPTNIYSTGIHFFKTERDLIEDMKERGHIYPNTQE